MKTQINTPMSAIAPKSIIFGAKGLLGKQFSNYYQTIYPDLIRTHYRHEEGMAIFDLAEPSISHLHISTGDYHYAIIAASIARLDLCEKNPTYTHERNVKGTLKLASQLIQMGITPIVFSTDNVFDGKTGGYTENSQVAAVNEYGKQYSEIELQIPKICGKNYIIVRLCKVYGTNKGDRTLIDEIISNLVRKKPIKLAHDQILTPIHIRDVIDGVIALQQRHYRGLINLCGPQSYSRLDMGELIANKLKISNPNIHKVSIEELKELYDRPKNVSMSCHKFISETQIHPEPIEQSIDDLIHQYLTANELAVERNSYIS